MISSLPYQGVLYATPRQDTIAQQGGQTTRRCVRLNIRLRAMLLADPITGLMPFVRLLRGYYVVLHNFRILSRINPTPTPWRVQESHTLEGVAI
jgi:hypothetical protein